MTELRDWLAEELNRRGWSQKDLTQKSGISQPLISQVLAGTRSPTADFCVKIAQAVGYSSEFVLRLAGILPTESTTPEDATTQELIELIKNLSPENRADVLEYVRFRLQQQEGRD